jgi:hypothetical protein
MSATDIIPDRTILHVPLACIPQPERESRSRMPAIRATDLNSMKGSPDC